LDRAEKVQNFFQDSQKAPGGKEAFGTKIVWEWRRRYG
jgi:hypothetical protein